jgi:hypothetical protein
MISIKEQFFINNLESFKNDNIKRAQKLKIYNDNHKKERHALNTSESYRAKNRIRARRDYLKITKIKRHDPLPSMQN